MLEIQGSIHVTKLMNSNSYSITAYSIPCNTDSYYSVIIITAYQTSPKYISS